MDRRKREDKRLRIRWANKRRDDIDVPVVTDDEIDERDDEEREAECVDEDT